MRTCSLFLILCLGVSTLLAQDYQKTSSGVKTSQGGIDLELQFITPSVVRVVKAPQGHVYTKESVSVIAKPQKVNFQTTAKDNQIILSSGSIKVCVNTQTGAITYQTSKGEILLTEKETGPKFIDFNDAGVKTYTAYQPFLLDKEEGIYGLGQLQNGKMIQRNMTKNLIQGNVEDVSPFFQSTKGYGLFWDNYSPTLFTDNESETSFRSEVADCIDYYFMYGANADGVIAQMRYLTGEVPMFPLWTYGFWQSKERYKSQEETVGVVKKYRELGVPLDGIIQDWQYWGNNYLWNAMEFKNPLFSDPQRMIDEVHNMNAHMVISIWSSFGPMTKPYKEMDKKGMLFNISTWPQSGLETWPPEMDYPSGVRVYDAYNPEARNIYWKYLNEGIFQKGMDGWWMDSTEPDHLDWKPEDMDTKTFLGSFRKVRNIYPLMTVGGVYTHQRAVSNDKRVFILTRSGFVGQQRYGANVWTGDVASTWESLRNQIPAGLNFSLCGMPHWNSDIGGFFAGHYNKSWNDGSGSKNPMFQELYVRWLQFGAFTPMMRSHGTDVPREIYNFGVKGEPVYDAIEKMIKLRYSLLPYIYSTSWDVTNNQSTFMRALVMDFVDDKKVWDINDQYMFGKSLLVAPIVHAQYTPEKEVKVSEEEGWNRDSAKKVGNNALTNFAETKTTKLYLPAGTVWYDFWTNQKQMGGQEITKEISLDVIPLFVKAGSIIPMGPDVQYATEKSWDQLQLRVYTGADGFFTLYEDEFDNYNYEKGAYIEIPMKWHDSGRKLTIGDTKGSYPGMLKNRTFKVVLQDGKQKIVHYNGKKVTVSF